MLNRHLLVPATAFLASLELVTAQQPGKTAEVHPKLTTYKCTTAGGCRAQDTSVVLDWNSRKIHDGDKPCVSSTGAVDKDLCPDEATCAANCVVEGVDYEAVGVSTKGDTLTMYEYVFDNGSYSNASPRLYLLGPDGNYVNMALLNQELSFDVDLSTLPCGENGALYLSQMDPSGGRNKLNPGGANYGSGYCDAQCPVQNWKNGTLNSDASGYCCNEMDLLEANSQAIAFTPHPCNDNSTDCDKAGCGFNPYALGHKSYYGPGMTVDTSSVFTVTTQFKTDSKGTLSEIVRKYTQKGAVVASAQEGGDVITESWCVAKDEGIAAFGGLATMGKALDSGMVLVFSIWNDNTQYMNWLDAEGAGPCNSTEGKPSTILSNDPTTHVVFSNIRWGDIGSTTSN